jgi:glycosyltransferase involved in cell wall biosynthesis
MWRLYHQQRADQQRLRRFQSLVTHSEYVREEYLRHGFASDHVTRIPFWVPGQPAPRSDSVDLSPTGSVRLLFLGRCEEVKGGGVLLDALPILARRLGRRVELTLAGEGPRRDHWLEMARRIMSSHPQVGIELPGWLGRVQRDAALGASHVIVVPSLWPEPFGMIGIEAGFHSVPAVAFDVGGVREWLTEGVNGHFAPGSQPTAEGLAEALVRVFADSGHYQSLRAGALEATRRFTETAHLDALTACMDRCHAEDVRR